MNEFWKKFLQYRGWLDEGSMSPLRVLGVRMRALIVLLSVGLQPYRELLNEVPGNKSTEKEVTGCL